MGEISSIVGLIYLATKRAYAEPNTINNYFSQKFTLDELKTVSQLVEGSKTALPWVTECHMTFKGTEVLFS